MTIEEARKIEERFSRESNPSEEDIFLYTEAMVFLIHEENKPEDIMQLGGWYYECRKFDLALKYYEMASTFLIHLWPVQHIWQTRLFWKRLKSVKS